MEEVCTGCLCAGRKLHLIGETGFYELYIQLLNEIPAGGVYGVVVRVCWECRATLRRVQRFKLQLRHCYTEALWNIPPPSLPPRLSTHAQPNISVSPSDSPPHSVKDEPAHDDVKLEEHWEPETFVNALHVEKITTPKKSKKKSKSRKQKKSKVKASETLKYESSEPELCIDDTQYEDDNNIDNQIIDDDIDKKIEKDDIKEKVEDIGEEKTIEDGTGRDLQVKVTVESVNEGTDTKKSVLPAANVSPPQILSDKPQCVECGKIFSSRKTYRYHLNVLHRGQNSHPCPRCDKVYQWKSNLGRHLRSHKAVDSGELYCESCDKSFASVATYRQHLKISKRHVTENDFSYTCDECGKKFVNKTRLRDHIDWEHLNRVKFRCHICNKPYKCHTSLYVHLQNVHHNKDKKNNLCHVCGKSYQNPAKLRHHITALHSGETPYSCAQCGAAFSWYSSLYRHVRELHYKMKAQPKKSKKTKKLETQPPPYLNYQT